MTPEQLAKSGTEHAEQTALFCWAAMAANHGFITADIMESYTANAFRANTPVPELKWLHAIPNAGARGNKVAASQLKAEGVKAGVADILLPVRIRRGQEAETAWFIHRKGFYDFCGLYIEMKRKDGKPSDVTKEQTDFMVFVESQGYAWQVAFGWRMAADIIKRYMALRPTT